jgi:beta-glucanase (GH16 family)
MELSPRSMASVWMVGLEEEPEQSGEICVFEVFGDAIQNIGSGIHPFRDPMLTDEFDAPRMNIDVAEPHVYGVDWREGSVGFSVDGAPVKTIGQAPGYPMQMMIGVFDFPEKPGPDDHVPMVAVDFVRSG